MQVFAYHRGLSPLIGALIAISLVELGVVHLLVALLWSGWAALALSIVSIATIAWLLALVRSFRRLPVEIDGDRLRLRAGSLRAIDLTRDQVARLRADFTGAEVNVPHVLKLSLLAYPNVMIELVDPVASGRRRIAAVAHRLDDAPAFAAAFATWHAGGAAEGDEAAPALTRPAMR